MDPVEVGMDSIRRFEAKKARAAGSSAPACSAPEYRAEFLWPHEDGSVEEAGYEFANGRTDGYQREWWKILCDRIAAQNAEVSIER